MLVLVMLCVSALATAETAFSTDFELVEGRNYTENKDTTCVLHEAVSKVDTAKIVYKGQFTNVNGCIAAALNDSRTTAYTWFDPKFNHATKEWASGCYARIDGTYPKNKKVLVYSGTITPAGPPTPPTPVAPSPVAPTPAPPTPAAPTPAPKVPTPAAPTPAAPTPAPGPMPTIKHTTITAPAGIGHTPSCGGSPQAGAIGSTFYFMPVPGAPANISVYDASADGGGWSTIEVPGSSGVMSMLSGGSMTAVDGMGAGDYLVASGGGSNRVVSYDLTTKVWKGEKGLLHKIKNSCSVSCSGLFYTMTGDFSKADDEIDDGTFKPSDRQIYAYNFSSGVVFANNGDKTRGGAGCACGPATDGVPASKSVVLFAGGFSDSGVTSQVEMWHYPLARRGEPKLSISQKSRDIGGGSCGGLAIFAGGDDGSKTAYDTVETFKTNLNVSVPADLKPVRYKMAQALTLVRIGCIGGRYALISGGLSGKSCGKNVYLLDTAKPPAPGSSLPVLATLSATGSVAVGTTMAGKSVGFFDGKTLDLFEVA